MPRRSSSRGRTTQPKSSTTNDLANRIKIRKHRSRSKSSRSKSPSKRQSLSLFAQYDTDSSGSISFDELCSALRGLSHLSPNGEVEWDDASVRLMLDQADVDGDGEIDETEFLRMMAKVESGAMTLHHNWYALSASAAEKTISDTHRQVNNTFNKASNYVRAQLDSPNTGKVGFSHKILAFSVDAVYCALVYISLLLLAKSWDQMDFNTVFSVLESAGAPRGAFSTVFDNILAHIGEDAADGLQLTITATSTALLVGLFMFSLVLRGQTVGQMTMSQQPVRSADESQLGLVNSLLYIVLGIVTLDPFTGLGSNIMGVDILFRSATTTAASSSSRSSTTTGFNTGLSKTSLANMCNQPLGKRPFSDPGWLFLYVGLTYFILTEGQDGGESVVATLMATLHAWSPYAKAIAHVPEVAVAHPGIIVASVLAMVVSTTVFLVVARQFLRPLLYAMVFGWAGTMLYAVVQAPSMAMAMIPPLLALRYVWHYRASFELQIAIYQEAVVATVVHPLLPILVPIMEALFYVFQLEMTTRYVGLEMNNWMNWGQDTSFKNNERLALWAMRIYIPWTLQSGRALFEMMCASVIGRYYYRKATKNQSILTQNHVSRTVQGVAGVVLKSTGTALGFGFMGMMIGVLQKSHAQLCDKYSKLSLMQPLHWIPIAVLFVLKYVVALVIYYFEVMHRNGVSYAGMTGETVFESAKRAQSIMATDGALVLTEHSGTGKLSAICVSASATLATALMSYGWEPLKENVSYFYGTESNLSDYSDKELQGICVVCMLSMAVSTVQVLSRAADTIMLCALDEMAYDGHKIRHASESLKTQIHGYMEKKTSFPSMFWTCFVTVLFAGSCAGLEYLKASGQIDGPQHMASVLASIVVAIFL